MAGVVEEESDRPFSVSINLPSTALELPAGGMIGVVEEEIEMPCIFLAEL